MARWVIGPVYNAHGASKPTDVQLHTRRHLAQAATDLLQSMGGGLRDPAPRGLAEEVVYQSAIDALEAVEGGVRREAILYWMAEQATDPAKQRTLYSQAHRVAILLRDARRETRANTRRKR